MTKEQIWAQLSTPGLLDYTNAGHEAKRVLILLFEQKSINAGGIASLGEQHGIKLLPFLGLKILSEYYFYSPEAIDRAIATLEKIQFILSKQRTDPKLFWQTLKELMFSLQAN